MPEKGGSLARVAERSIVVELQIAATPEHVWDVISDTRRYAEWVVNTLEVTRADSDVADVGVTYDERNKVAGPYNARSTWKVVESERPRHTVHEGEGIPLASRMVLELTLAPAGEGATHYTHRFAYEPGLGPLGPLVDVALAPLLRRDMRKSAENLKALIEAG